MPKPHAFVCAVGMLLTASVGVSADDTNLPPELSAAEQKIYAALEQPVALGFSDASLLDIIEQIRDDRDIAVQIDSRALEDLGIDSSQPITIDVKGVSLRSALRLMFRNLDLAFIIKDEVLVITTIDEAELILSSRVYPVLDLVKIYPWQSALKSKRRMDSSEPPVDFEALIGLATKIIAPGFWIENGGSGGVSPAGPDQIVVSQCQTVHDEVARLFAKIREVPPLHEQPPDKAYPPIRLEGETAKRIRKALSEPATFNFSETPLDKIVAALADEYKISIHLDTRSLEDLGIAVDDPVTFRIEDVSLRSALQRMLYDLELTMIVDNEILLITSVDTEWETTEPVIYPVGDIVERHFDDDGKTLRLDFKGLTESITTAIHNDSWDENGGSGAIRAFEQRGLLVVEQTAHAHDDLIRFLNQLRAARKRSGYRPAAEKPNPAEVVTRVYWLTVEDEERTAVRDAVRSYVEELSMPKGDEVEPFVVEFTDRFVVRHRRDVQAKLQRFLLDELGICSLQQKDRDPEPPKSNENNGLRRGGGIFAPAMVGR